MTPEEIEKIAIPHLTTQFERALPILFTGAGFPLNAKNLAGEDVPSCDGIKNKLWNLCFPGEPFEPDTSLQHLFEHALLRHKAELSTLLTRQLTINADSLPDWYQQVFKMPWFRCYTLNIDDLDLAVSRRFILPRQITSMSARIRSGAPVPQIEAGSSLEAIHLNGCVKEGPEGVTFSVTQYAERLATADPWYLQLSADLVSHSFVFIGTQLDEPPLWQYVELRRSRGSRGQRELRPKSYLITPHLNRARQALLTEYNVIWLPMTAEEFAATILEKLKESADKGNRLIEARSIQHKKHSGVLIPEVSSLARHPDMKTDYLLGQEPVWADIQSGRAIVRTSDEVLWGTVSERARKRDHRGAIVITGTAGSGKSTALRRICLRLTADGIRVGWIDAFSEISPRNIRAAMQRDDAPQVLAIDDADMYGAELASIIREITAYDTYPLLILGIRSGKIERVLNPSVLRGVEVSEHVMPPLEDSDIDKLIEILDRENRLGILRGKSQTEQRQLFRDQAGRHLLVAMIQATSGRRFEEKAVEELLELDDDSAAIYSFIAVASALRFSLTRDEVLIASGDQSNKTLNILDQLLRRHIIVATDNGDLHARHRVIAEILLKELQLRRDLSRVISGLILVAATKAAPGQPRSSRPWRMLKLFINHEFLIRTIGLEAARNIYGEYEQLLTWDYHYWLQRGSLEVEFGDLSLAENFLNQAKSLASEDSLVDNEIAYLLFKKALANPAGVDAKRNVNEATAILEELIHKRGHIDSYPFHVLASQGLAWSRRTIRNRQEKEKYLRYLLTHIENGLKKHPRNDDLVTMHRDLKAELLGLAVR